MFSAAGFPDIPLEGLLGQPAHLGKLHGLEDLAGPNWRSIGAEVDLNSAIPGPFGACLRKVGNRRNAFARLQRDEPYQLSPGKEVVFGVTVARSTSIVSALVLHAAEDQLELRVRWTSMPPEIRLLSRSGALHASQSFAVPIGGEAYSVVLGAENISDRTMNITASFYISRGVENAGLSAGMYAGAVTLKPGIEHLP